METQANEKGRKGKRALLAVHPKAQFKGHAFSSSIEGAWMGPFGDVSAQ